MMIPLTLAAPEKPRRISEVFCRGNTKLGPHVLTYSLPAVLSCPGKSKECVAHCYVEKPDTLFSMPSHAERYWNNWQLSLQPDFAEIVSSMLQRTRVDRLVRLHVSGDFYDENYVWKWLQIVTRNPRCTFWAYTRSWVNPAIRSVLYKLAECKNFFLWFSTDRSMRRIRQPNPRIRWAYMMVAPDDAPPDVDLYFRTHALRKKIVKRINGTLVCPAENGVTHTNCEKCRLCFTARPTRKGSDALLPLR